MNKRSATGFKLLLSLMASLYLTSAIATNISSTITLNPKIDHWDKHSFKGETHYQDSELNNQPYIRASSQGTASGLIKEIKVDLTKTPILKWQWRVENTLKNANEQIKSGDDFPARIYVVEKHSFLPWKTRAINYVWSSHQPTNSYWDNPYTGQSKMVAVRSGSDLLGTVLNEQRNVREDFKTLFNRDVKEIHVVAIMTDTDDTKQSAEAYYGDIVFLPASAPITQNSAD